LKKLIFFLLLIGVGIALLSLFRQELTQLGRPWLERRGFLEERRAVSLYFSDREADYLVGERREITKGEDVQDGAGEVVRELIRGPKGRLLPTLPSKTRLLSLQIDERGIARVNFSSSLSKDHPGGSSAEMMTVYSVVNSLALNFPEIKRVQFLVEGREIESIAGHLSLGQTIPPKPDLIKNSKGEHN